MADGHSVTWDDEATQPQVKWDEASAAAKTAPATATTPPQPSTWEKLTRGYNPDVEQFAEKHPVIGPVVRGLDAAGGAVMSLPGSVASSVIHPIDTAKGAINSLADWGRPETWKGAWGVLPEALGQGIGTMAGSEGAGAAAAEVGRIPKISQSIAESARVRTPRNPTGALKPAVKTMGQAGGAAIGGLTRGGAGALAGYAFGPKALDMLIPNLKPLEAAPETIPKVGTAAQESGYYPPVTRVPIRPEPSYKLTPESVPGPDTAGKGNLLSPLAKRGDPRAAAELQRRGRNVIYVPAEEYPAPRSIQHMDEPSEENIRKTFRK